MINSFSSLLEVLSSISILFVAVEYVQSFTDKICDRLFMIKSKVDVTFAQCKAILTDSQTLSKMKPVVLDSEVSTEIKLEECKRENEKLVAEIESKTKIFKDNISKSCKITYMPAVCLIMFLMSLFLLFLGGLEEIYSKLADQITFWASLYSLVYIYFGCYFGEKHPQAYSLRNSTKAALIIIVSSVLSAPFGFIFPSAGDDIECITFITVPLTVALFYFVYVVSLLQIKKKGEAYLKLLGAAGLDIRERCMAAENNLAKLKIVENLKNELKFEDVSLASRNVLSE